MAKKTYVGVNNVARNVSKMYVGVNGVARKVKKAYVGVNGVAKQCYQKQVSPSNFTTARKNHGGANAGKYVIFCGGINTSDTDLNSTEVYDDSLTKVSTNVTLSYARYSFGSGSISLSNYAIFAGGYNASDSADSATVDVINDSLTRITATPLSNARCANASVSNVKSSDGTNEYLVICGGISWANTVTIYDTVEAYDKSLTKISGISNLSYKAYNGACNKTSSHIVVGGGNTRTSSGLTNQVNAYDASLTRSIPSSLSTPKKDFASANVNGCAIFASGATNSAGSTTTKTVDKYDDSLTVNILKDAPTGAYVIAGASLKNYAVFAGGITGNGSAISNVYAYKKTFTQEIFTSLNQARLYIAGASVDGEYAMFGGGTNNALATAYDDVEVYDNNNKIF